jgi:WD40 repeat protein
LTQRLELLPHVARACNAIAYAHSRGVIHRDIKPDNIMIGEFGETVVLDWGIAKLRGVAATDGRARPRGVVELTATSAGDLVGTPLYMSPEQALGEQDLDETTDVWSLGVLLYVVLSGRVPFFGDDLAAVRAQILRGRPKALRKLEPNLGPELVAIAERALARDKSERYPDAKHLATDLDAFMSGSRVLAHQYSMFDLVRRFARRHRAASWVALLAIVVLVGVAGSLQRRLLHERDRAISAEKTALEKEHLARVSLAEFYGDRAQASIARGDLAGALTYSARSLAESETPRARGLVVALTGLEMWLPTSVPTAAVDEARRGYARFLTWQGSALVRAVDAKDGRVFEWPLVEPLSSGVITRDGHISALGGRTGKVTLWWPDTQRVSSLEGHRGSVVALAFTDDSTVLATAGLDRSVHLWDVSSGTLLGTAPAELGQPSALGFGDSNTRLFVATQEHELFELDTRDWSRIRRIAVGDDSIQSIALASSELVVGATAKGQLAWGKTRPELGSVVTHPSNVLALAYLSDTRLAAGGLARDGVCLIDWSRGACATRLPIQSDQVRVLASSPPTHRLAVGMSDGNVMIWDTTSLLPVRGLNGHKSTIRGLSFVPNGAYLVSASLDGALIKWDAHTGAMVWRQVADKGIQHLACDLANDAIWASTRGGVVERRSLSGELTGSVLVSGDWAMASAPSRVHQALFVVNGEGTVLAVDPISLTVRESREGHSGRALSAELSPDEQLLATAGEDGVVLLWRSATLEPLARLVHHKGAVRALRFSPDGRYLASAGDDRCIRNWDLSQLLTSPVELLGAVSKRTAAAEPSGPAGPVAP